MRVGAVYVEGDYVVFRRADGYDYPRRGADARPVARYSYSVRWGAVTIGSGLRSASAARDLIEDHKRESEQS